MNILGEPISIVRYKIDTNFKKVIGLDYYTNKKDIKIRTEIRPSEESAQKDSYLYIDVYGDNVTSYYLEKQFGHRLYFYRNIAENINKKIKPLKIKKNTTSEAIKIDIPFGYFNIQVPLDPGYTAIYYLSYVCIYDKNSIEVCRYIISHDGLYQILLDGAVFTFIDPEEGSSSGSYLLGGMINHNNEMPILNQIFPITNLPTKLVDNDLRYKIEYDEYGLMKSIESERDDNPFKLFYKRFITDIPDDKAIESVHSLIFDNFDFENHYKNNLLVRETITESKNNGELEYIGIVYDDSVDVKDDSSDRIKIIDFDEFVKKYFNY